MNIEDLTLRQIREIQALSSPENAGNITSSAIGKYVIVRTRNEGLNAGYLVKADSTGCVISQARRIWYHRPKDRKTAWFEGVAKSGLSDDSKISCAVDQKYIIEDYSLTLCSKDAEESIKKHPSHES